MTIMGRRVLSPLTDLLSPVKPKFHYAASDSTWSKLLECGLYGRFAARVCCRLCLECRHSLCPAIRQSSSVL